MSINVPNINGVIFTSFIISSLYIFIISSFKCVGLNIDSTGFTPHHIYSTEYNSEQSTSLYRYFIHAVNKKMKEDDLSNIRGLSQHILRPTIHSAV